MDVFVFIITPPEAVEVIYFTHRFEVGEMTFLVVPLVDIPAINEALLSRCLYFRSSATLERDFPRACGTGILYKHGFSGLLSP